VLATTLPYLIYETEKPGGKKITKSFYDSLVIFELNDETRIDFLLVRCATNAEDDNGESN
jgi:hypothetical protein